MNVKRIAALLRELADAIETVEPKRKRRKVVAVPAAETSPEAQASARRALRRAGVAA